MEQNNRDWRMPVPVFGTTGNCVLRSARLFFEMKGIGKEERDGKENCNQQKPK